MEYFLCQLNLRVYSTVLRPLQIQLPDLNLLSSVYYLSFAIDQVYIDSAHYLTLDPS